MWDLTPSSVSLQAFQKDSQLAVITTASSNCSYFESEENRAQVNMVVH